MNRSSGLTTIASKKSALLYAFIGAALTYGALSISSNDAQQRQQITALEHKILDLELLVAQQEQALNNAYAVGITTTATPLAMATPATSSTAANTTTSVDQQDTEQSQANASIVVDSNQVLKALSTQSDRDPRSFPDKINDLLASNPSQENVAIASKGMVDLTDNRDLLPDYALESIYQEHSNPELKRVAAQVLSARGDNRLLEKQINTLAPRLHSESPEERQRALVELAKTHYAGAATAIAPLLQDDNVGVKLDALLALRATGNQGHIRWADPLRNDPDPAVSWLANDVVNHLQNLSETARTRLTDSDIASGIPLMAHTN
ncbi:hypothetical protein CBP51_06530 [Cellvibrio mixtus]|uniref:HEAT repeat domain-containing protein n=1 Tax=Cellvibrio mixtus TaxID=39650 RepID=A0A266Q9U5_9GAMM|nr:HEAT repeat domain-containing protein [Cellvibrio mixtus]OZY86667.1 hypothetical protein CBP51_06530 [Cellvibrio mixtus]